MRDFRKLAVRAKAHQLALATYRHTAAWPSNEVFALTSQTRRSASSIASKIAEGCGRDGDAELTRFLGIALGSASELEYQLLLARDLGYLNLTDYDEAAGEIVEVKRMLGGLITRLKRPT
jgi:four helix bundle protein